LPCKGKISVIDDVLFIDEHDRAMIAMVIQNPIISTSRGVINSITKDVSFMTDTYVFKTSVVDSDKNPANVNGIIFDVYINQDTYRNPMYEITSTIYGKISGTYLRDTELFIIDAMSKDTEPYTEKLVFDTADGSPGYLMEKIHVGDGLTSSIEENNGIQSLNVSIDDNVLKEIAYRQIATPKILFLSSTMSVTDQMTLDSSTYKQIDGFTGEHTSTDWQIATDSDFVNVVYESLSDTDHLTTSVEISAMNLNHGNEYYVRCRYHSNEFDSAWSSTVKFSTVIPVIKQPIIILINHDEILLPFNLISTQYETVYHNEPHVSTDWQIATDSDFTNIVYESLEDTDHLTESWEDLSINLNASTTYYVRCRYRSESYMSEWSVYFPIKATDPYIRRPSVLYPSNNFLAFKYGESIISSTYNPINHSEFHVSTDWQIATDSDFTNIVYESLSDATHLTESDIITSNLEQDTLYFARCRHRSESYLSEWSHVRLFKCIPGEIATPSIITPYNHSSDISEDVFITSNDYNPINHSESHIATDWQISKSSTFATSIYDTTNDTDHLTSIGTLADLG
jgi:hypothetical protein